MHRERNWGGCGVKVKRFPSFAATLEVLGSNPAWGEIFCKNFYSVCFISRTFKKTFSYFRSYKRLKQLLSVEGALRLFPKCQFPDLQQSRLLFRRTTFGKLTYEIRKSPRSRTIRDTPFGSGLRCPENESG